MKPAAPATSLVTLARTIDVESVGHELHDRIRRLYPICRSITGNGLRESLRAVAEEIDLRTTEVPSGTKVFDWTVPKEWNIRDAYIRDRHGTRRVDFRASNLHVMSYSVPVDRRMSLESLRPHLFTMPGRPDWIPYKTSYYEETWGFCLSESQLAALEDDEYDVRIDTSLEPGALTLGECFIAGSSPDEVLFSAHLCHPSLCNDNLAGVSVAVTLARLLSGASLRYSYRFLFNPGTIGAITWLALNDARTARIKHGLVLACLGDRGKIHYKRSRRGDSEIDRATECVLAASPSPADVRDFTPDGYDERQYCSPGFNLPVGTLSRTPHDRFPEYHSSADNLDFVDPAALADSLMTCLAVIEVLEGNAVYMNRQAKCEPQLGQRGLYSAADRHDPETAARQSALSWVLNMSDGTASLLDIARRSGLPFPLIRQAASVLEDHDLLTLVMPA